MRRIYKNFDSKSTRWLTEDFAVTLGHLVTAVPAAIVGFACMFEMAMYFPDDAGWKELLQTIGVWIFILILVCLVVFWGGEVARAIYLWFRPRR